MRFKVTPASPPPTCEIVRNIPNCTYQAGVNYATTQGNRQWRGKGGTQGTANFSSTTSSWGKGLGRGHLRERPAPGEVEGVGETSPQVAPSKEGDNSTKPVLNRVQHILWETCPSGFPSPGLESYHRDLKVSSAGSVCIESVSNSNPDADSSEHEERRHRKTHYPSQPLCSQRGLPKILQPLPVLGRT